MSLKLNSSGGGSVTLQEPVTASTLTLNLPAFSGTVATLASVTNNGVLYVNSSGQPTSGSALTFDGTNLGVGVGGVGTAPIDVASNGSAIGLMLRGRSADSIGTLQFQSNDGVTVRAQIQSRGDELRILSAGNVPITSYVNGSEQMRLTSTGLGIGTSSPGVKLDVNGALRIGLASNPTTIASNSQFYDQSGIGPTISGYNFEVRTGNPTPSARMIVDSAGNVGIGTSSPSCRLDVAASTDAISATFRGRASDDIAVLRFATAANVETAAIDIRPGSAMIFAFGSGRTERMRLDASGRLLVGQTSDSINARLSVTSTSNGFHAVSTDVANGSVAGSFERNNLGILVNFRNNGSDISGAYIYNNTTSVSYATGSDYRLKEDVQPMTGALAKVVALKPVTYKWKVNGSAGQGFIAHELAEVCPDAVTGEKDAVDAKGNPKYQGVDTSFLVATLTAAIQELKAEFDAYKATHP